MTKKENNNLNFNISMYALVEKLLDYNSTTKALCVRKIQKKARKSYEACKSRDLL